MHPLLYFPNLVHYYTVFLLILTEGVILNLHFPFLFSSIWNQISPFQPLTYQ